MKVYSPYTDRMLWVNPETIRKMGEEEAKKFTVRREGAMLRGLCKVCECVADTLMLDKIETKIENWIVTTE
jgi:hypothetical protein